MFRLPFGRRNVPVHPFASPREARAWLEALGRADTSTRLESFVATLDPFVASSAQMTADFVRGLFLVDAALDVDRRKLFDWYPEALNRSPALAARLWTTLAAAVESATQAYRRAFDTALGNGSAPRWQGIAALAGARLLHFRGLALLVRMSRSDLVLAPFWADLHALYLRAERAGVARDATDLADLDPLLAGASIEHEYIHVLLLGLLRTGNLAPGELVWAGDCLAEWSRGLALIEHPDIAEGYVVATTPPTGLQRHDGDGNPTDPEPEGSAPSEPPDARYLDTTALVRAIVRALATYATAADIGDSDSGDDGGVQSTTTQRIRVLERMYASLAARRGVDLRRSRRVATAESAAVCLGLSGIGRMLAPGNPLSTTTPQALEWQIVDRSASGVRATSRSSIATLATLGTLVAMWSEMEPGWRLAVVRRFARDDGSGAGGVTVGLSLFNGDFRSLSLRASLAGDNVEGFTVDGLDAGHLGPSFPALELAAATGAGGVPEPRSLIIPGGEYSSGRQIVAFGIGDPYRLVFGRVIEQQAGWVRVAFETPEERSN